MLFGRFSARHGWLSHFPSSARVFFLSRDLRVCVFSVFRARSIIDEDPNQGSCQASLAEQFPALRHINFNAHNSLAQISPNARPSYSFILINITSSYPIFADIAYSRFSNFPCTFNVDKNTDLRLEVSLSGFISRGASRVATH